MAEIAFEIAIIGADGIERCGEERCFHRRQHLPDDLITEDYLLTNRFYRRDPSASSDLPDDVRQILGCLLYTSPSPRDRQKSRMPSSA